MCANFNMYSVSHIDCVILNFSLYIDMGENFYCGKTLQFVKVRKS